MSAREFSVASPHRRRPAGRSDPDQYDGVELYVASEHLKSRPLDAVRLTDQQALEMAAKLIAAVALGMNRP